MPHDMYGQLVQEGETVLIPCKVVSITTGEEYCNATLATLKPMPPYTMPTTIVLNTKQLVHEFAPDSQNK